MQRRDTAIAVNGMTLHLTEWGPQAGRPLFMLHGIRGYAETFAGIAQALQPDFRVLAYDQRGRGASSWDPQRNYYTDAYVDDLAGVADALGLDRFDLLGHSMGGIAAIVFAARHPQRVRRLIVEDAGPAAFEGSAGAARIQRELRETPEFFPDIAAAREYLRALRPSVTEAAREDRLRHMLKEDGAGGWIWRHDHAGIAATRLDPAPARVVDLWPQGQALGCPTLVVRGGRSDYLQAQTARDMAARNPNVEWVEIEGAGHYIHDDQPAAFEQAVGGFLRRA
ncbi:alpha/beta fold hydrolase [Achromobacter aegrifaciens]|uniref:alpha/beta fold hydrolase n=1 Tax=Achromobacter aegrifaciens TaxID=1287736 RepID=UPI000F73BAEE|nr:alpha/beta hydrolase [Achromobacter aegrifaciens]RSE95446.1 alpha/beta fold hydrolase [Achromobacter aegrifaciens]